ncbi:hypothetical protein BC835DRAFT_1422378 [Cytidiella melzeri]|nr:hypothetical protein BC835DRAFT_1422378 [Cytidiella melzeri]
MSQQTPATPEAITALRAWNTTPPPPLSPRLLNSINFPTPDAAAKCAAEEKLTRITTQKERKALAEARKAEEEATAKARAQAGATIPTPLSNATHKPPQPLENHHALKPVTNDGEEDRETKTPDPSLDKSFFSPVAHGTKHRRSGYEVLGQLPHSLLEGADKAEGGSTGTCRRQAARPPKQRKAPHKGKICAVRDTEPTNEGHNNRPDTPTPKIRRGGAPYGGRDSPLASHRQQGRQRRKLSGLHEGRDEHMEEDAEWKEVNNLDRIDISCILDDAPTLSEALYPSSHLDALRTVPGHSPLIKTPPYAPTESLLPLTIIIPQPVTLPLASAALQANTSQGSAHPNISPWDTPTTSSIPYRSISELHNEQPQIITQALTAHEPLTTKIEELKFLYPADDFELPRGDDPCFAYDNLDNDQMEDWPLMTGHSFLVRLTGRGCPTAATEQARREEILSLLKRTIGTPPHIRITAPAATQPFSGNRHPPHNFLVYNVDKAYFDHTTGFGGCTSTKEGTLFFSPNFPVSNSLIGSIDGFEDATADQIHALVNRAFDGGNLNIALRRIIESQDLGSQLMTVIRPEIG